MTDDRTIVEDGFAMPDRDVWNLEPPNQFQGLREDLPLRIYVRHLPHWRQAGATYFVTFRLADSLPAVKLQELSRLRIRWERKTAGMQGRELLERLARLILLRVERWLDQGLGSCVLRDTQLSRMVEDSLLYFHQHRYELGASVIMPNHVHCIVRPFGTDDRQLEEITGSWKSYTSRRIHGILGKSGVLWQDESYDRIVRDEEHLWQCLQYIGSNPRKVGLTDAEYRLWVNPTWQAIGWKFSR